MEKNSFFKLCNERYVVFLERATSKKDYELIFRKQFFLSELQHITWCISTKQKDGTVSYLNIADYENVFNYSFDFNWRLGEKNSSMFQQDIRIQKTSGGFFDPSPPIS